MQASGFLLRSTNDWLSSIAPSDAIYLYVLVYTFLGRCPWYEKFLVEIVLFTIFVTARTFQSIAKFPLLLIQQTASAIHNSFLVTNLLPFLSLDTFVFLSKQSKRGPNSIFP